jgi:hypothetical protein
MTSPAIQQRCWNHPEREASCRCPRCGRSFCRECVTEHRAQLLCATCLEAAAQERPSGQRVFRRFLPAAMALAGFVLAWFVFCGAGQAFLESLARPEQTWQKR